jgi:hypothetical protein
MDVYGAYFLTWVPLDSCTAPRCEMPNAAILEETAREMPGVHHLGGSLGDPRVCDKLSPQTLQNAVCEMLAETNTVLDFTCFEMRDVLQAGFAHSRPQGLVQSAAQATVNKGVGFAGENALACWEDEG